MDEVRRIRFLIAPILFVTSLLWAMWLDPNPYWRDLIKHVLQLPKDNSVVTLIAAVVGGTFAVQPVLLSVR